MPRLKITRAQTTSLHPEMQSGGSPRLALIADVQFAELPRRTRAGEGNEQPQPRHPALATFSATGGTAFFSLSPRSRSILVESCD